MAWRLVQDLEEVGVEASPPCIGKGKMFLVEEDGGDRRTEGG